LPVADAEASGVAVDAVPYAPEVAAPFTAMRAVAVPRFARAYTPPSTFLSSITCISEPALIVMTVSAPLAAKV
jgi:hypothetical protein